MRKIGNTIISENLDLTLPKQTRKAMRGIVKKGKQVLMIYSTYFNDYTFPGGGVEIDEHPLDCLRREMAEEAGVIIASEVTPYGYIEEMRESFEEANLIFHQRSEYYICHAINYVEPQLEDYEETYGYQSRYVNIKEALDCNEEVIKDEIHQRPGFSTALKRENTVLRALLKEADDA